MPVSIDVREGQQIVLKCRFNLEDLRSKNITKPTYVWRKKDRSRADLVTFNDEYYDPQHTLTFDLVNGNYDLTIKSTTYDKDNSRYECAIKQSGTGREVVAASYLVTILSKFSASTLQIFDLTIRFVS